jgi:RNA polymerase sigma factor (sigma-70 family)
MAQTQDVNLLQHLRKLVMAQCPSQQTDRQLLQQFIADADEPAFAGLVQRHGAMVLGVCRSVLRHQQDAEDALQATFLVLARKASSIRKQQSVGSWLHGVAYRLALKAKAQVGKRRAQETPAPEPVTASTVDDLSVRELQAILHEELQRLPEKYRTPLLLCYWEGKTRDEAAEQLGWAKGTFKEKLERARNLLRSRLTRRGLVPSAALFTALLAQNAVQAVISSSLIEATTRAALAFAAGKTASVGLSATVTALAAGAIRTMQITQWATMALIVIFLGTLGSGIGFLATRQADAQSQAVAKGQLKQKEEPGKDGQPKTEANDIAQEELRKLQGVWEVKSFEHKGVSKAAGPYAYRFAGEKFTFERDGKIFYEGTVKLVPAKKPKSIDLVIVEGEVKGETNLGLYGLDGDALKLAFNPGGKERPKELKTGADADTKIWHYQRKKQAARKNQLPEVEWLDHPKNLMISDLKIELAAGARVIRTKTALLLPAKITNQSTKAITTKLAHEWHGGEWPPTDLYASVTEEGEASATAFRPVYQVGERAGKANEAVTIAPEKSIEVELRMDWPGTGSVMAIPLMKASEQGKYKVRLLLVFEADGKQQYVVGAETVVELPAQTKVDKPAAKGIDPVTVAAYEKLGATYGVLVRSDLHIVFTPGDAAAEKSLPAFRFEKEDPKAKLPDVSVPFGLQFASRSITDTGLKELLGLKNLSVLYLGGTQVTDAGLKELAGLKNLSTLSLFDTQVTDTGLKELASLKNLSWLDLGYTKVTDTGVKELAGLKNLSRLNLEGTGVADAGLKELAGLKNLSVLYLGGTRVAGAGLKELAGLKSLSTLHLGGTRVADAGLKELAGVKNLSVLYLNNTQVTNVGLKELLGLKNLSVLYLSDTRVTDAGLKELAGLKNLSTLWLSSTKVTDAGLKEIAGLKNLSVLYLTATRVTDAGLKELAGLKNLSTLDLTKTQVTDAGLKELAGLKNLSTLHLSGTQVTDAGLKELAGLRDLSNLSLANTRVTDAGLKELASLKNLSVLYLDSLAVTDAGLKELAGLKNLSTLWLSYTAVTDAGLKEIAGLKNLSVLNLNYTQVTDPGVAVLLKALPKCNIVYRAFR